MSRAGTGLKPAMLMRHMAMSKETIAQCPMMSGVEAKLDEPAAGQKD
ncbi:MAG: hypothetical protein K2X03_26985 [Bryobacteraceae bacterium]|nr:hypothetical protein [Bryobacteraceae bacterium]